MPGLAGAVGSALAATGISPASLYLEVTEAIFDRNPAGAATALEELAGAGVSLYLDGFGIDRSDLVVLSSHPFAGVKLMASTPFRTLRGIARRSAGDGPVHGRQGNRDSGPTRAHRGCDAAQGSRSRAPRTRRDGALPRVQGRVGFR